ncbi:MAG: hypothetical protein ABI321_04525 [Polyangia bacterium]
MTGSARGDGSSSRGFEWAGELGEVSVQALYAACHALRFSGRLELRDDNHEAKVIFLGGDPIEIDGGDTQVIALWGNGQFRAVQSLPNLAGDLTGQVEQTGSLAVTQAKRLLAWVSEYRLTCTISIERPGEKAQLVFKNGQLESANVNGKPELAALARVQAWNDGFYRVSLRPLFADGTMALAAQPVEGVAPGGPREFDLSRSIPLDLKPKRPPAPAGVIAVGDGSIEAEREALRKKSGHTADTQPSVGALERHAPLAVPPPPSRWPIVVAALLVAGAGTLAALYALHLPPFSPPPRPIEAPPPVLDKPLEPVVDEKPVVEKHVVPDEPVAPETPVVEKHVVEKHVAPEKLEPKTETPSTLPAQTGTEQRLVDKGRLLLIEGHPHSALELFRKAEQLAPGNPLPRLLEQQALGKLGRAELQLEGKGHVTIDGKRYDAPKKLKLFAGPHAVDSGAGPEELTLKKNEHKKLRIRP